MCLDKASKDNTEHNDLHRFIQIENSSENIKFTEIECELSSGRL